MTYAEQDDLVPGHPDTDLPARDRVGFLIFQWDDRTPDEARTVEEYRTLADLILRHLAAHPA